MLVPMEKLLQKAQHAGYAVGAFEFWSYDSALAVIEAAKQYGAPVILQVGHFERDYMNGFGNAFRLASMAAEHTDLPVALHLDHSESYKEIVAALETGFTSVMIDASAMPFEENVALTKKVVETAAPYGASVEAELGRLAGEEGSCKGVNAGTDPIQAAEFTQRTGIDALAVSIGTAHGFYTSTPKIDIPLLQKIRAQVSVPLVLHGGSGTPEDKVQAAIRSGIAKVNICTEFIAAFGKTLKQVQEVPGFKYNVFSLFREGMLSGRALALEKIRLFDPDHKLGQKECL